MKNLYNIALGLFMILLSIVAFSALAAAIINLILFDF